MKIPAHLLKVSKHRVFKLFAYGHLAVYFLANTSFHTRPVLINEDHCYLLAKLLCYFHIHIIQLVSLSDELTLLPLFIGSQLDLIW